MNLIINDLKDKLVILDKVNFNNTDFTPFFNLLFLGAFYLMFGLSPSLRQKKNVIKSKEFKKRLGITFNDVAGLKDQKIEI